MKSRFSIGKLFYNDKFVMFFSVLLAFGIWVSVSSGTTQVSKNFIEKIPISMPQLANDLKFYGVDNSLTAKVRVSGNALIVRDLTADDIEVSPVDDIAKITGPGYYELKLSAQKGSMKSDYEFIENTLSPTSINVYVDREGEGDFEISSSGIIASTDSSHHIDTIVLAQKKVHVEGPESEVNKIAKAVAVYNFSGALTETQNVEADIVLYDKNDEVIESDFLKMDISKVNVSVPVLDVKNLNVIPVFSNAPDSFDVAEAMKDGIITVDPSNIEIAIPNDTDEVTDEMTTKEIDLSKINLANNELTVDLSIPSGVRMNDIENAKVTFDNAKLTSKKITVKNFELINPDERYITTVLTKSIEVTVIGESSQIKNLTAANITANIDMSDKQGFTGSTTMNVKLSFNAKYNYCWAYWEDDESNYKVNVNVTEKTETSKELSE